MSNYTLRKVYVGDESGNGWVMHAIRADGRQFGIYRWNFLGRPFYEIHALTSCPWLSHYPEHKRRVVLPVSKAYRSKSYAVRLLKKMLNDLSIMADDMAVHEYSNKHAAPESDD